MSDTGEFGQEVDGRVRPHRAAAVIVALAAAFGYGAIDQYLGALNSSFLADLSMMSAPWLLVPFLAGAWQSGQRRAAVVGLAATWLSVVGYVLMIISPMEGTHLGPRPVGMIGSWNQLSPHLFLTTLASQWLWFAGGLIAGPLYGWLGYRWRSRGSRATALLAVLPVLFEPAARWLADRSGLASVSGLAFHELSYGPAAIAEVSVGLTLTVIAVAAMTRKSPWQDLKPGLFARFRELHDWGFARDLFTPTGAALVSRHGHPAVVLAPSWRCSPARFSRRCLTGLVSGLLLFARRAVFSSVLLDRSPSDR